MITLATLSKASLQDIFTQACTHLLTQNAKSKRRMFSGALNCAYRGENGFKCAVGCFISDEEYKPSMDECAISNVIALSTRPDFPSGVSEVKINLLTKLQKIHDCEEVSNWIEALLQLAIDYDLEWV